MEKSYIGVDLSSRGCEVAVIDTNGGVRSTVAVRTDAVELVKTIAPWGPAALVAVEQGELSNWACEALEPYVEDVLVGDPKRISWIARDPKKNDRVDAIKLAQLLRAGMLPTVYRASSRELADFKRLVQHYEEMTRGQAKLKVKIRSQLRREGVVEIRGLFGAKGRDRALKSLPPGIIRELVADLYDALEAMEKVQSEAARKMKMAARSFPVNVVLTKKVPGLGIVNASRFIAYVQDPNRFSNKRQLWRYARLGVADPRTGGKSIGPQRLDRSGCGSLKDVSRKTFETARRMKRENVVKVFFQESMERTGNELHARLNAQRKILAMMRAIWREEETKRGSDIQG